MKIGEEIEDKVCSYIRSLTVNSGIVNKAITIAVCKGFIISKDRSVLKEYSETIDVNKEWARYFLEQLNYIKRKGTKAARKLPVDYLAVKETYLNRILATVKEFKIHPSMIVNWDQTGVNIVPTGEWTLAPKGAKQVSIFGLDDKRQITVLFAVSLDGQLLPPQLLYAEKTDICYSQFDSPSDWDVWHSKSH